MDKTEEFEEITLSNFLNNLPKIIPPNLTGADTPRKYQYQWEVAEVLYLKNIIENPENFIGVLCDYCSDILLVFNNGVHQIQVKAKDIGQNKFTVSTLTYRKRGGKSIIDKEYDTYNRVEKIFKVNKISFISNGDFDVVLDHPIDVRELNSQYPIQFVNKLNFKSKFGEKYHLDLEVETLVKNFIREKIGSVPTKFLNLMLDKLKIKFLEANSSKDGIESLIDKNWIENEFKFIKESEKFYFLESKLGGKMNDAKFPNIKIRRAFNLKDDYQRQLYQVNSILDEKSLKKYLQKLEYELDAIQKKNLNMIKPKKLDKLYKNCIESNVKFYSDTSKNPNTKILKDFSMSHFYNEANKCKYKWCSYEF